MNNIFKKVISAAIAVSTLGSIALPVYAAETPEVSEDNITTAEATEKFSIKDEYYARLKNYQRRATILQSLDKDDVVYPYGSKGDSYVEGVDEDGVPYKYQVEIAPNGHLFYAKDILNENENYEWYCDIQRAIDKGDSKVIDGRTFVTIDGCDYEYYIGEKKGNNSPEFYWNIPTSYNIRFELEWIVYGDIYKIDSIFDAMQEGYELYQEAIENDTLSYMDMKPEYIDGERTLVMPDNEAIMDSLKYGILRGVTHTLYNKRSFDDLNDELKQEYAQSTDEMKMLTEWVFNENSHSATVSADKLFDSYVGDINGDKLIDMNDVTLLKKQLIHKVELSPMQQRMTSTNSESTLDVRDITNLTQYLVKMTDSIN